MNRGFKERRLMMKNDQKRGYQNFLIEDSDFSLWTSLAYFEMPELLDSYQKIGL